MSGGWSAYCPPGTPPPEHAAACPLPWIDAPNGQTPILMVVSSSAALAAAREFQNSYPQMPLVLWAWRLAESLAVDAEAAFPVVYGWPDEDAVNDAYVAGPGRSDSTHALFDLEAAFGFSIGFDCTAAAAAARQHL